MTKAQLIKALENYPDDEEVLVNMLTDGDPIWFSILNVDINIPATLLIDTLPCME